MSFIKCHSNSYKYLTVTSMFTHFQGMVGFAFNNITIQILVLLQETIWLLKIGQNMHANMEDICWASHMHISSTFCTAQILNVKIIHNPHSKYVITSLINTGVIINTCVVFSFSQAELAAMHSSMDGRCDCSDCWWVVVWWGTEER